MYVLEKIIPALSLVLIVSFYSTASFSDEESPENIVKTNVNKVVDILKDKDLDEDQKRQSIYSIAKKHIDFEGMSRRILTVNWKKASDNQKVKFISLFETILLDYYWARMKNYSGEHVQYLDSSIKKIKYASVDTVIVRTEGVRFEGSKVEIPITYRMELKDGHWRAYDFLVENLSLVQNYRREYLPIVKNDGLEGLLDYMDQQIESS